MKTVTFAKPFDFIKKYRRGEDTMHFKVGDTKQVTEAIYSAAKKAGVLAPEQPEKIKD
jgi:hypothetical protein